MNNISHILKRTRFWLEWPALFVYFGIGSRSRVLIRDGDNILLVKGSWKRWYDDDGLGLSGGGIGRRESPVEGAVRELAEELGIEVPVSALQSLGTATVWNYGLGYRGHFFSLQLPQATALRLQKNEIADAQWVSLATLPASLVLKPEVHRALQLYSDR